MPAEAAPCEAIVAMSRDEFAAFYRRTAPALRKYLSRGSANPDLADDLLQDAYIRVIGGAPAGEAQRRAYLYRTATHLLFDRFRQERRERDRLALWGRSQPTAADPWQPATGVERVFRMLSVRERALLWLAHVEEAGHAEIARAMKCGEASVRFMLFRARRKMRRLLAENRIAEGGGR